MRLLAAFLLACAPAWGALDPCPQPPSGYEAGVTANLPSSYIGTPIGGFQVVLSTADADADMQALEDILADAETPDANPEYRVKLTNTAGGDLSFALIDIGVGVDAKLVIGFEIAVTATDGGRVCIYVDQDKSQSSDLSDCSTSTGGFRSWDFVYFGGSTVNWADCGSNALSAVEGSPTAGELGPLGVSWTYSSAASDAHSAANTGASGEFASADYTMIVAGKAVYATDNKSTGVIPSEVITRGPNSSAGGPDFRWQSAGSNTEGEVQPPGGATGVSYRHIAAATDFAIGFTHDQSTVQRAWKNGNTAAVNSFSFAGSTPAPTTNFNFGRDALSTNTHWDGELYFVARRADVLYDDNPNGYYMEPTLTMLTDQDSFWVVSAISTSTVFGPPPAIMFWITNRTPANSSGLCAGGETALGDGCAGYEYGLDVLLGAGR